MIHKVALKLIENMKKFKDLRCYIHITFNTSSVKNEIKIGCGEILDNCCPVLLVIK